MFDSNASCDTPAMDTELALEAFARAAGDFRRWAEGQPTDAANDALQARQLCAELFRRALDLPKSFSEANVPEIAHEDWTTIYKRFGSLPFNYYSECLDPLRVPAEEAVTADLADDLADIWRDIKPGLGLWSLGLRDAAAWQWRFHFEAHWAHHITAAIYVLQSWFSANTEWGK